MRHLITVIGVVFFTGAAAIQAADSVTVPAPKYSAQQLAGDYLRGKSPGLCVQLRLQANGEYSAAWDGCQHETGVAQGSWTISGDVILLRPASETETAQGRRSLKAQMRQLRIIRQGQDVVFVPDPADAYFLAKGVDSRSAFHRPDATLK